MTLRAYRIALAILIAFVAASIFASSGSLPEAVRTTASRPETAVATQSRESFRHAMLLMAGLVPVVGWVVSGLLPRVAPFFIRIPNRDYWLATGRRNETLDWLERHAIVTVGGVALFLLALHFLTLRANLLDPPRSEPWTVSTLGTCMIAFGFATSIVFQIHFRRVPKLPQGER